MPEFLKETEQEYKTIKKLYKDMETSLHETIKWFAMDPRKVTTEDFFTYFVKFITIFEKARKESEFIRETKKKEQHKREVEEAARKKREKMKGREEQELTHSEDNKKPQKGILDDLLSKIEQGEVGPKKSGLQKKGQGPRSMGIKNKQTPNPIRQLSSVDEDKLREPEIKPLNPTPRGYTNLPPLRETRLPYNSPQAHIPTNPIVLPSYNTNSSQVPPSYNIARGVNSYPKVTPSYNANSQNLSYQQNPTFATSYKPNPTRTTSFNDYTIYPQEPETQPLRPPLPRQIPSNEKYSSEPKMIPIPPTRVPPQIPDPQTNHYPYQRPKPPAAVPRAMSLTQSPQPDDTNGMSSDNTFSDKLAMFNKVGAVRKTPRNTRNVTEESTFF